LAPDMRGRIFRRAAVLTAATVPLRISFSRQSQKKIDTHPNLCDQQADWPSSKTLKSLDSIIDEGGHSGMAKYEGQRTASHQSVTTRNCNLKKKVVLRTLHFAYTVYGSFALPGDADKHNSIQILERTSFCREADNTCDQVEADIEVTS